MNKKKIFQKSVQYKIKNYGMSEKDGKRFQSLVNGYVSLSSQLKRRYEIKTVVAGERTV